MNNRQGMNSRLPYNQRAFSPQRMSGSSNYPTSNMNQSSAFSSSSSNFQQPFYQMQKDTGRSSNFSNNQRNQSDPWIWDEMESSRSNMRNSGSQNVQERSAKFGSSSTQNFSDPGSWYNPQSSSGNFQSLGFAADYISLNSDARYQPSSSGSNRNRESNFGSSRQQRSELGQGYLSEMSRDRRPNRMEQNFGVWEDDRRNVGSSQQKFGGGRQDSHNPRQGTGNKRQNLGSGRPGVDNSRQSTGNARQNLGSARQNPGSARQNLGSARQNFGNSKPNPGTSRQIFGTKPQKPGSSEQNSTKPTATTTSAPQNKPRERKPIEVFPDIGEPTIQPKFEEVFAFVKNTESGAKVYSCRVCKVDCLPENNIKPHLGGKKHKYHLKLIEDSLPGKTKAAKEKRFKSAVTDKLTFHKSKFEFICSLITKPLVALEYIIEILDSHAKEQLYICVLCDKRCDPRTIDNHLISQTHKMNYLTKHFGPIATRLQESRRFNEDLRHRQEILMKITEKIASKFDRATHFIYEGHDFALTKSEIYENINMKKHVTIDDIPNAEEELLEGIMLSDPEWESQNPPKPPKEPLEVPEGVKRKRKVPEKVIEEYREAVKYATTTMENKLKDYERDPDSHPKYKAEWEIFWNRKIDEMSKRGEDPTNQNFHDEWCKFFVKRMRELNDEEIKWKTDQIRKNLGLSIEDIESFEGTSSKRSRQDSQESNDDKNEVSLSDRKGRFYVSDNDEDSFDEDFREFGPRIPKDVLYTKEKKIFNKFLNTVGIDLSKPKQIEVMKPKPAPENPQPTTLVTTCRILLSLEQELGLLAPKVLDLLTKSISFEKENSRTSNELLDENENLLLIETVKEKIIGMKMANLITNNKTGAVEKAINEIDALIEQHEVMINIKKTLKEMGKDEAAPEEIEMLKAMFMKKKVEDPVDINDGNDETGDIRKRRRRQVRRGKGDGASAENKQ